MSRQYYNTKEQIVDLFLTHPVMSGLLEEFEIDNEKVKDVADYLILNNSEIFDTQLGAFYNDSDIIDNVAELYGYTKLPSESWDQYVSTKGIKLTELLNFTLYYYKFGTTDNFYENNILTFLPEYDREQIEKSEKLKLTVQSLGRKLDDVEDKIARILDVYDFDKCPDELLDYLGQNLGYEREDYTLAGVSFRELLKNIIEIYKIKGTNYSFSFFFKFLGFEINLKEFYFNRDLKNPENFPGIDERRVEYFLTINNPIIDTSEIEAGVDFKPIKNLEITRNLNDWDTEIESLTSYGCINPSEYMRGVESYNNDGITFHSNPWTYFKTNLIEYELNPFVDGTLTTSDNETIKKYVRFLSPTYLFTWINVNLRPWIEDINIISDTDDDWKINIIKTLGDPRPTPEPWPFTRKTASDSGFEPPYLDYENMSDWINIFNPDADNLFFNIINNLNIGGDEIMGTTLKRDGVHIRQPGHPQHISDARHRGDKRLSFDILGLEIKPFLEADIPENWDDYSYRPYPATPVDPTPFDGKTITDTNNITFDWEDIVGQQGYWIQVSKSQQFSNLMIDDDTLTLSEFDPGTSFHNDSYYWRLKVRNDADLLATDPLRWGPWSSIWNFKIKAIPFPYDNETLDEETQYVLPVYQWNNDNTQQFFISAKFDILWESIQGVQSYEIYINSINLVDPIQEILTANSYNVSLTNGTYTWKIKTNTEGVWSDWGTEKTFIINFPTII